MATHRYFTLDHWRGLACLAVLVNHSVWYRSGSALEQSVFDAAQRLWMGVPIFFVISGYCISAAVHSHLAQTSRPLHVYFTRRLRRIFPPYWAVLGATLFAVAAIDVAAPSLGLISSGEFLRPWWYAPRQWLGNITLTEIWRYHVLPGQKALMLGHAWTLCYEEQFYVVAGVLLWLMPRRFFFGTLVVTAATLAVVAMLPLSRVEGFFFDGSWFQFWFGMVVYQSLTRGRGARLAALALFAAVALLMVADWPRLVEVEKNATQALLVASVFAATVVLLHPYDMALASIRALKPIELCGVMCYSLYLVHLPVVKFLRSFAVVLHWHPGPLISLAVCAPICLAVAWAFHRTVERRFLNTSTSPSVRSATVALPA